MPEGRAIQQSSICCLSEPDYRRRIAWIEDLTRRALRRRRREGLRLRLAYAPEAAGDVRLMVEQEQSCCPSLTFELQQEPDAIAITITVPEAAQASADTLFAPFLAGETSRAT